LEKEHLLSEQLKNFSNLKKAAALNEENMTKKELLAIINLLFNSVNLFDHPNYR
ncbi:32728_t:CDS:2, partial [Racocetra persica]